MSKLRAMAECLRTTNRSLKPEFREKIAQEVDRLATIERRVRELADELASEVSSHNRIKPFNEYEGGRVDKADFIESRLRDILDIEEEMGDAESMDEFDRIQHAIAEQGGETCPACEQGTLTRIECCMCDTCKAEPVLPDQIRRNDARLLPRNAQLEVRVPEAVRRLPNEWRGRGFVLIAHRTYCKCANELDRALAEQGD